MGDRTTWFEDCPSCKGKETVEVYDASSSMTFSRRCEKCGWTDHKDYYNVDDNTIELMTKEEAVRKGILVMCPRCKKDCESWEIKEHKTCFMCWQDDKIREENVVMEEERKKKAEFKVGLIGAGWIGSHLAQNFKERGYNPIQYSLDPAFIGNKEKIKDCEIVFIAVPTPSTPEGFDDHILKEVIKLVGKGKIAVIKSTILPNTAFDLQKANQDIIVLHSPEFLTEAVAKFDTDNPQRNIIGLTIVKEEQIAAAKKVLKILPKATEEFICTSVESSLVKYAGNCFFYFKNIFFNMLYDLSAKYPEADWVKIKEMIIADDRIGEAHTNPVHKGGRGAGGDCLLKDMEAFRKLYNKMVVEDNNGKNILNFVVLKNLELLEESKKDLEKIKAIYGYLKYT